ncbi:hypothetical protein HNR46_001633 [Haloferula luteola]|uniref:GYF domain-containing protein n=1 Tax=Haloferula luteola TaxID=595692 RepID=A0A840UZ49_9BACT|nr:DUF4190 domain-containing protein [Haloferula luteola]MBB5351397.1 hypothetical protein [Haloferula luteola]
MSQWYYSHDGQQKGPVPVSELSRLASVGEFDPEKDLVWREGMPDWQPAVTVDDLPFGEPAAPPEVPATPAPPAQEVASPYQAPVSPPAPSAGSTSPVATTSGLAIASLVCGLCGFFTCILWFLSLPIAVAAIITGHMAHSQIRALPAERQGKGLATVGLILGYLSALLAALSAAFGIWIATQTPDQIRGQEIIPENLREEFARQLERQQQFLEQHEESKQP